MLPPALQVYGLYQFQYRWETCYVIIFGNILHCRRAQPDPFPPTSDLKLDIFDLKGRAAKPVLPDPTHT